MRLASAASSSANFCIRAGETKATKIHNNNNNEETSLRPQKLVGASCKLCASLVQEATAAAAAGCFCPERRRVVRTRRGRDHARARCLGLPRLTRARPGGRRAPRVRTRTDWPASCAATDSAFVLYQGEACAELGDGSISCNASCFASSSFLLLVVASLSVSSDEEERKSRAI